jgi:hypothetical protein
MGRSLIKRPAPMKPARLSKIASTLGSPSKGSAGRRQSLDPETAARDWDAAPAAEEAEVEAEMQSLSPKRLSIAVAHGRVMSEADVMKTLDVLCEHVAGGEGDASEVLERMALHLRQKVMESVCRCCSGCVLWGLHSRSWYSICIHCIHPSAKPLIRRPGTCAVPRPRHVLHLMTRWRRFWR